MSLNREAHMLRTFLAVLVAAMLSSTCVYAADVLDEPHPLNEDQQNSIDEMYPVDPNPDGVYVITEEDLALAEAIKQAELKLAEEELNNHICFQIQCE